MTWLIIDAVLIMLGCVLLGALMAWLLAVALYPTRAEGLASWRATRRAGAERERDARAVQQPYRAEPHRLDDDEPDDADAVEDGPRDERHPSDAVSGGADERTYRSRSEARIEARRAGRTGVRR